MNHRFVGRTLPVHSAEDMAARLLVPASATKPMATQTHVYDSEAALRIMRQRAARVSAWGAGMVTVSGALLALGAFDVLSQPLVLMLLAMGWLLTGGWIGRRLHALRRIVWYLRLTPTKVTGSDYVRQSTTIAWSAVAYVNVSDEMLTIVGPGLSVIQVPPLFVGYDRLVRQVIDRAMAHEARVYLDGTPLDHAPLDAIAAVLSASSSADDDS